MTIYKVTIKVRGKRMKGVWLGKGEMCVNAIGSHVTDSGSDDAELTVSGIFARS